MQPDLRALVLSRGTIAAVARALGLPYRTLDKWVRGDTHPPAYVLASVRERIEALPVRNPTNGDDR